MELIFNPLIASCKKIATIVYPPGSVMRRQRFSAVLGMLVLSLAVFALFNNPVSFGNGGNSGKLPGFANYNIIEVEQSSNLFATCDGLFTITTVRTYDPATNKTTYTFTVTRTGAQNALSHWGFPIILCPGTNVTIQQFLAGSVAQTSLDQVNWTNASISYGPDPSTSPQCTSGNVLKFNTAMGNETTRYYRLIVNGNYSLIPATAYVKYGPNCCTIDINPGNCLQQVCIPPDCTISGPSGVCPNSTNQYNGPAGNDTYSWQIIAGNATISGSSTGQNVQVQAGSDCGSFTLQLTTTKDGCESICSETYNITDVTPPVFTFCPPGQNLGCNPTNIPGPGAATATDNCGGSPTITSLLGDPVNAGGCNWSRTRVYTATDGCGNVATCAQVFTYVVDNTPPVFTGSYANVELGCNPADPNASLGGATATDACSTPTITQSDGPIITNNCLRSRTRTFTAKDACNNTATTSRTVTWTVDITPPVFTGSYATVPLGCNPTSSAITAALGGATATDACSTPTIGTPSDGNVQSSGCNRSQTRTFTATDFCGNTATVSRSVTWTADVTAPVFTGTYANVELGCNPTSGAITAALGGATATDACSTPTISQSDGSVQSSGCLRTQTRTFTATDFCGNTATVSRSVTWTADVTAPVFTGTYANVPLGCNPVASAITAALGGATATDACSTPTINCTDGPVITNGCLRSQIRTCIATDACGNTASVTRTVTWTVDVTAPVFTGNYANVPLGCNPTSSAITAALGGATATDACSTPSISQSDGSVQSSNCLRTQTRTFTATDFCGNTATVSRSVTWTVDVTPPVFVTTPASIDIACDAPIPDVVNPTASDACGTSTVSGPVVTDNPADCSTGFNRIITRTWTATDGCGNTASYTQTIRVECCDAICTYTQGYYGNAGGTSCDGTNGGLTTAQLIAHSLGNWGGTLTVGKPGRSVVMNNVAADINCIIAKLPGGGPAKELPAGNYNICNLPNSVAPGGGRIRNILLAQTLTLGLNLGIGSPSPLAGFVLQGGVLATQESVEGCGDNTPKERICVYNPDPPYNLVNVVNEYLYSYISPSVVNAIVGPKTVANLFALANNALANTDGIIGSENGVSLGAISETVGAINEAFDECRIFIGWDVAPCPPTDPDAFVEARTYAPSLFDKELAVTAFPNPYEESFSLKINSPVSGNALVEFYTFDGRKITESRKSVLANSDAIVQFNVPPSVYRSRIVYVVTIDKYTQRGIVLSPN
jgi:hypothetical protein